MESERESESASESAIAGFPATVDSHMSYPLAESADFDLNKLCITSFCKGRFPHKFVNLYFIITDIKNELTALCTR